MRIIYIRSLDMAVQILNDMPDAAVHRGDPDYALLRELEHAACGVSLRKPGVHRQRRLPCTWSLAAVLINMRHDALVAKESEPIIATMSTRRRPKQRRRPSTFLRQPTSCTRCAPPDLSFESDAITPEVTTTAIATPSHASGRAAAWSSRSNTCAHQRPCIRSESQRRRERGTVLLRVLVDALGRPRRFRSNVRAATRASTTPRETRRESPVPATRSERRRAGRAGTHPHRVHAPRHLNSTLRAGMMRASG